MRMTEELTRSNGLGSRLRLLTNAGTILRDAHLQSPEGHKIQAAQQEHYHSLLTEEPAGKKERSGETLAKQI